MGPLYGKQRYCQKCRAAHWSAHRPTRDQLSPEQRLRMHAREHTRTLIARGQLVREPCVVCAATAEAHHPDYAKPDEVVWLCMTHHRAVHEAEKLGRPVSLPVTYARTRHRRQVVTRIVRSDPPPRQGRCCVTWGGTCEHCVVERFPGEPIASAAIRPRETTQAWNAAEDALRWTRADWERI